MAQNSFQTVLITGASSGIGAAIAKAFAKNGAALSLAAIDADNLPLVAQECKDLGAKNVVEIVVDLAQKDGIKRVFEETTKTYDTLDVLVNSAGINLIGSTESTTFEVYDELFDVNLRPQFFLIQLFIPYLEKAKGNVINISSICSQLHRLNCIAYDTTKAGIDHFTKTAALELSAKGIRVNAINPGTVRTNLLKNLEMEVSVDEYFAHSALSIPLNKRTIEADEIADAVLFLSSDAARMITGVCLRVDGGQTLQGLYYTTPMK